MPVSADEGGSARRGTGLSGPVHTVRYARTQQSGKILAAVRNLERIMRVEIRRGTSGSRSGTGYRRLCLVAVAAVFALLLSHGDARAQASEDAVPSAEPEIEYDEAAGNLVLSFGDAPGELAEKAGGPTLHIYGDGRVLVHYPPYMKRAGEYSTRLKRAELHRLLRSLARKGLVDFDPAAARRSIRRERAAERARAGRSGSAEGPELFERSDAALTEIELRLSRYRAAGETGPARRNLHKKIAWRGLRDDAKRFRKLSAIQNLAAARNELRALMKRPDLEKRW